MSKFEKMILSIFFVDLFVGGGGRLIDIGPISIRQLLFVVIFVMYMTRLVVTKNLLNKKVNQFISINLASISVYLLIFTFALSTMIGYLNGNPLGEILTDILRGSFIGLYFPFAYYLSVGGYQKKWIIQILKICGLLAALLTIAIDIAGKFIFISENSFLKFYIFINSFIGNEIFFRTSRGIFYKGHLYILFALIICLYLWLNKKASLLDKLTVFIATLSIVWSETRGILLALILAIFVIMVIDSKVLYDQEKLKQKGVTLKNLLTKEHMTKMVICLILLVGLPFVYKHTSNIRTVNDPGMTNIDSKVTDKNGETPDISIGTRMLIIRSSATILTKSPKNIVVGHGYGTKIAERTTGIEISFLDILVEQGLIGLFAWLFISLLPILYYYKGYKLRNYQIDSIDVALMTCLLGMLLLTNINPFINNPIGMSFLILVLIFSKNSYEPVQGSA